MSLVESVFLSSQAWARKEGLSFSAYNETSSTHDHAKEEAFTDLPPFKLYLARHQTKGRGRHSNSWQDTNSGGELLSTWSYAVPTSPQPMATALIGLCLFQSVTAIWPSLKWSLKPPNDLYLGHKKLAGILVEAASLGNRFRLMAGIGVNVLSPPIPGETATHLTCDETGIGSGLDESKWHLFLKSLLDHIDLSLHQMTQSTLESSARHGLLYALNAYPGKSHDILEVSPHGDLVTEYGTIPWWKI